MEDISGENLTVLKSPTFIGIDLLKKGIQATDPVPGDVEKWPRVQNISFKNVRVQDVTGLVDGQMSPCRALSTVSHSPIFREPARAALPSPI